MNIKEKLLRELSLIQPGKYSQEQILIILTQAVIELIPDKIEVTSSEPSVDVYHANTNIRICDECSGKDGHTFEVTSGNFKKYVCEVCIKSYIA